MKRYLSLLPIGLVMAGCAGQPSTVDEVESQASTQSAEEIHQSAWVLDAHADIVAEGEQSPYAGADGRSRVEPSKMRAGGMDAVVMAVAVSPGPRNDEGYRAARAEADRKLAAVNALVAVPSNNIVVARTADEVVAAHRAGKLSLILGFQNALILGRDVAALDKFYESGVRVFALTHMGYNDFADPSRPLFDAATGTHEPDAEHGGLSTLGETAIGRINALGGVVEVTQLSTAATLEVLKLSKAPVIANDRYASLVPLANARSDATAIHQVLQESYGFRSKLLLDATRLQMFEGIAALKDVTGPDDLVLIYYAGHGVSKRALSYWLPVDIRSREEAPGVGLSSEEVVNWIKTIPARHVMVIADSCYSGQGIAESGGTTFRAADAERMLPFLIRSRSRTMLTSGGDGPVLDGGGGGQHSVFTRELLGVFRENQGILYGAQLFSHMRERVKYTVDGDAINQTPTFGSIDRAGHESGQFVFVNAKVKA